jgi:hypothetical protein
MRVLVSHSSLVWFLLVPAEAFDASNYVITHKADIYALGEPGTAHVRIRLVVGTSR